MALDDTDRRSDDGQRDRVQKLIDKSARAAAWRVGMIVFFALLSLIVGATVWQRTVNGRLDSSEMRACERVQNQRERANVSEARQFLLLRAVTSSPRASERVRARFGVLANTTVYDPPTDCPAAVRHPGSYRRPPSRPFYTLSTEYIEAVVQAAKDRKQQPVPTM